MLDAVEAHLASRASLHDQARMLFVLFGRTDASGRSLAQSWLETGALELNNDAICDGLDEARHS